MSTVAKVFVVLNFLLAVAFLGAAATLLGNQDAYKTQLETERKDHRFKAEQLAKQVEEKAKENTVLTGRIADANTNAEKAKTEADLRKSQNDMLTAEINKTAASHEALSKALKTATESAGERDKLIGTLQDERKKLLDAREAAEKNAAEAVRVQNKLEQDLENATALLQDKEAKLTSTQEENKQLSFRLEAARRSGGTVPAEAQPAQRAKVMAADNAMNIVVISLGSEDGVAVGFRYTISRGNKYIATLVIKKVDAKLASGATELVADGQAVAVGDDATSK